jgi:hypothetical protein
MNDRSAGSSDRSTGASTKIAGVLGGDEEQKPGPTLLRRDTNDTPSLGRAWRRVTIFRV